jgi:WD40 repeat protein
MKVSALAARQAESAAREQGEISLYHHRVVLAHREWLASNVGRATQLLDDCREDLRDWEWHYVRHLCDSAVFTLRGHTGPVMSTAFSRDGKLLASVSGRWFSSESADLKIWEANSGKLLWTGISAGAPLMSVAFNPDATLLATSSVVWGKQGGNVKLWNAHSGAVVHEFAGPPGTFCVSFSPDGQTLACGGSDGKIRLWNVVSKKQVAAIDAHSSNIFGVAYNPDGKLLVSAGWDGTARIWDVKQRKLLQTLSGPVDIRSVEFSPDGNRVVTASFDQSAKIWDVETGRLLHTYWGHTSALTCVRFSPDGRYVVSSDTSGGVQVWDAHTLKLFRTIRGHTSSVSTVAFNPDGMQIASAGTDQLVKIWDITAEQEALTLDNTGPTQNVVFSHDGKWLAAAGYRHSSGARRESRVRVWPTSDFARQRAWTGHTDWVTSVAFHPIKPLLISGSADKSARLWNLADGKTIRQFVGHTNTVSGVAFSPNGNRLATSSLDRTIKLWDVESGKLLAFEMRHPFPVLDLAFTHDGKFIVAVGEGGMVKVWDADSGRELHSLPGHQGTVERVQISPDGKLLATCGRDQTIRVWKVDFGSESPEPRKPVQIFASTAEWERISGLAFSADSTRLASGGRDHTIRIWDIASGSETLTLRGNIDHVNGLAFSSDRGLMASASTRNIRVWNAGSGQQNCPTTIEIRKHSEGIWHRKQADESQSARPAQWFAAAYHLTHLINHGADDWDLHRRRADAEIELRNWPAARADCQRSIALGATDPWPWVLLAVDSLRRNDGASYRKTCADMLARFRDTTNPEFANNAAWACALAPNAVDNYDIPLSLTLRAVAANQKDAACQSTLGAIQFRAGDYQQALDTLRKASTLASDGNPEDWLVKAMICQRLERRGEAEAWLAKATQWQTRSASIRGLGLDEAAFSQERMAEIAILRKEAESMLRTPSIPVTTTTQATSNRR